jgi:hypothetical protein
METLRHALLRRETPDLERFFDKRALFVMTGVAFPDKKPIR